MIANDSQTKRTPDLTTQQLQELETSLVFNPDDLNARSTLLEEYMMRGFQSRTSRKAHHRPKLRHKRYFAKPRLLTLPIRFGPFLLAIYVITEGISAIRN